MIYFTTAFAWTVLQAASISRMHGRAGGSQRKPSRIFPTPEAKIFAVYKLIFTLREKAAVFDK